VGRRSGSMISLSDPIINDIILAVIITIDSYIMFRLGWRSAEKRINKYLQKLSANPQPIILLIKNFLNSFKNDPELADPRIVTEMTKAILKAFKEDPEFQAITKDLASYFANSIVEQVKTKLPDALEEARAKSPVLDSIIKLLRMGSKKD